jgi:hypothetical protein
MLVSIIPVENTTTTTPTPPFGQQETIAVHGSQGSA